MRNRSVIEILVLVLLFVVSFVLVSTTIFIAVVEIRDPEADTTTSVQSLVALISGILGALLGLLAGKTQAVSDLDVRPDGSKSGLGRETKPSEEAPKPSPLPDGSGKAVK